MNRAEHAWLPRASCDESCVRAGGGQPGRPALAALRAAVRIAMTLLLLPAVVLLAVPLPGRSRAQRVYCRMVLRCLGVRIIVSGGPIRNLSGVLVVSGMFMMAWNMWRTWQQSRQWVEAPVLAPQHA